MEEVVVSVVATKLADYLVDPTIQQLQYLFCVGKIIRNVEIKKKELILKQGKVQKRVEEAIRKPERIDDEVNNWKNETVSLIAEVESLVQQLRANSDCFHRWCPTWRRYRLCKMLAKTSQRMTELNTRGDQLEPFFHPLIVQDIEYHSSKNFMFFKSTELAFGELLEALQDDNNSMIGLWGMGGSGKTTLVKQVGKKAKELKLFDRVIITTVSQTPNIWKIQGEIADLLGLELEQETEVGRARKIALRLQSPEERILIILDDVWAMLDLEDIGNPFGDEGPRNCKVLLTTRRKEVCILMACQKIIRLDLLKEDEAWNLFQTHANVDDAAKEAKAREIAMECKGLPIAIVAVGSCLKGKGIDEMDVMLYKLMNAKPVINEVDKGVKSAFSCLELSYNYLPTSKAKLLLLMCAMFPEDHNIAVEDLFKYGVGLGLCIDADSFEIERSQVKATIKILVDSSLLTHSLQFNMQGQEYVTMHDVVRDFALWKASDENHTIMVNHTKELNELIADEALKDCCVISSWYDNNKLLQFPSQLDAPKLEFLLLCSRKPLDISHVSFEGTKRLKALIIECTYMHRIELQPQSIQHLSNLRTLRLQHWDLHDISFVISLTRLEILDLEGSKFEKMPNGIENLNKLKLLDLSKCEIDECCYKAIGRCLQLEELYVSRHLPHTENENCYEYIVGLVALKKLRRYKIEIGEHSRGVVFQNEGIRYLRLGQLNISTLGARIKDLTQRATAIQFYELQGGSKCFTPNIVQAVGGMNELTKLYLERCLKIEYITDETTPHEDAVLHRLDELEIQDMGNLKQLCLGPSPFSLFQKLERLSISNCLQLLHIFPADCNLGNLKFLKISDCPMLTSIFPISTACTLFSLEELQIENCSELKHVLAGEGGGDEWGNSRFPKLRMLSVNYCRKLEYAYPVFLVQKFEQLRYLYIENAPQMKFVFGEEKPMHDPVETQIVLPHLEYLHLQKLPNLVGICSKKYCLGQSAIKTITCWNCPNMKWQEIGGHQLRNEEYNPLTAIESILLGNCGAETIFPCQIGIKEQIPTFQYLHELTLKKCARLKVVFPTHTHPCLPKLTYVTISCCEELEAIFRGNEETQKNQPIVESCLLKLKSLEISKCNKLKFILPFMISATTSMLSQLSTLTISDCSQMEEIFKCSNIEDHDIDSEREIKFPNMERMEIKNLPRLVNVCQGFKLHIGKFYRVEVHECPKLMPIMNATIDWTKESLVRKYELKKYRQLNNKEALNLSLSVLIPGELDIQSPKVEHKWRVIGDDEQEETNDSKMLRTEQQMLGGLVPTQVLCFQYLHSLEVTHIKKLKFLFSVKTIVQSSLPKLNYLTLSDCEELEEIIAENEEHQTKSNVQVGFPGLRELKVERCNKLKRLFSMSAATVVYSAHICQSLPELTSVTISGCEELEAVFSKNEETQKNVSITESCLLKLKSLNISECNKLKFILSFMTSAATSMLPQLSTLTVSNCSQMKEIFKVSNIEDDIDKEREITLPNMENMELYNLPRLVNVCQGFKLHIGKFYRVEVHECPKLMPIMNATIDWTKESLIRKYELKKYRQLNNKEALNLPLSVLIPGELDIQSPKVEHKWRVIGDDEQEETHDSKMLRTEQQMLGGLVPTQVLCFQYLHSLEVTHIKKLKFLFSVKTIVQSSLPKLNYLTLSDCEELEEIIAENEEHQTKSNVQVGFPGLRELKVERCNKLKRLFSMSAATVVYSAHICQSLPELTSVTISGCEELEAVFSKNEETQKNVSITESCLLKLKSLNISECNKLKFVLSFMISAATSMLPQLSALTVSNCSQMEEIFKVSNIEDDIDKEREITFPNMEHMELDNLPRLVNVCQGFKLHTEKFYYKVEVHDCPKFMPIKSATIDWTKERLLKEYKLKYSQLNNNEALNLPLSILNVGELDIQSPRVECKWRVIGDDEQEETNDPEMFRSEQQMLGGLVSKQVLSFQDLHSLEVTHIKKLKFLFPMSTIVQNSLPKLNSLTLSGCDELEVIFGHSGDDDANYSNTIMLSSLREIELTNLPRFMSICQVGLQIQVELRDINICNCPKFVDSSLGWALQQLGTISLPQVSTEDSNLQISSNAEQLPGNKEKGMKMLISRAERLCLHDSMNLTSIWEGPTFIIFQNLKELIVSECRKLTCMFPSAVIRSLPCLEGLGILECEELEEMMPSEEEEHNHFPNESFNSSLCFLQLRYLMVKRCRKLKWLFPSLPSTLRLPQLQYLHIEECSQIKGLFNSEIEIHEEGFYYNLLPKLISLTVQDCPIFSETMLAALQRRASEEDEISDFVLVCHTGQSKYSIFLG